MSSTAADVPAPSRSGTVARWAVRALPWLLLAAGVTRMVLALTVSQSSTGVRLGNDFVDLGVYRLGGRSILDGHRLYDAQYEIGNLPFTYPVFAALLFVPLALVPFGAAQVLMVVLSLAALAVSAVVVAAHLPVTLGRPLPWPRPVSVLGLFGLGGMLEPTTTTLDLGQVNLVLMAMVLVDLLLRWRGAGVLVGIATGVKIVPGVFILAMAAARRWRQVVLAASAFAGTVVAGALAAPEDSWAFWTRMFYKDDRQASVVTILNQSLYADLVRLLGRSAGLVAWVGVAAAVLALGLVVASRLWRWDSLASVATVAMTGLLVSPVSWNHHWVWLMPALAVSATLGVRQWSEGRRVLGGCAVAGTLACLVVTAVGPIKLASESLEFDHTVGNWLVGNSLTWAGAAFLALMWAVAPPARAEPEPGVVAESRHDARA